MVEIVELCLMMHIPKCSNDDFLFDKVIRLLMQLNYLNIALRLANLAVRICKKQLEGHCLQAQLLKGRCLEALGEYHNAIKVFTYIIESIEPEHQEANLALKRLQISEASSTVSSSATTTKSKVDSCAVEEEEEEEHIDEEPSTSTRGAWGRMVVRAQQRALENEGYTCLQRDSRVSQSIMYQLMRDFYSQRGLDAWGSGIERRNDIVPFYITSNPKIAQSYVKVLLANIHDMLLKGKFNIKEPIYVIELGTGPGKFSSLFLNELSFQLNTLSKLYDEIKVVYIMSDFTESNISAWKSDESLKPFIKQGLCDFALFNCDEMCNSIHLINSGIEISRKQPVINPIMLFSNYLFDSIKMDAFRVKKKKLCEALLTTFARKTDHIDEVLDVSIAGNIKQEWTYPIVPNPSTYYSNHPHHDIDIDIDDDDETTTATTASLSAVKEDNELDIFGNALSKVVESYCNELIDDSCFSIPLSGLKLFDTFIKFTKSQTVSMLIADKGHNRLRMLNQKSNPSISLHGSLSMMVNFDAINRFIKEYSTLLHNVPFSVIHTPQQNSDLDICLATVGMENYISKNVFIDNFSMFGVFDLFTLRDHVEDIMSNNAPPPEGDTHNGDTPPLSVIVALLKLSCWDPDLLGQFGDSIITILKSLHNNNEVKMITSNETMISVITLKSNMSKIGNNLNPRFDSDGSLKRTFDTVTDLLIDL